MPRGEKKLFECLLCSDGYSRHSVIKGDFYVESGICKDCYERMQNSSATLTCFGKLPTSKSFGYTPKHIVCSTICPDKTACAEFTSKLKRKG